MDRNRLNEIAKEIVKLSEKAEGLDLKIHSYVQEVTALVSDVGETEKRINAINKEIATAYHDTDDRLNGENS